MKHFLKFYSVPLSLALLLGMSNQLIFSAAPVTTSQATANPSVSVHDMFKDVPQDELLQMMEEGQQFIKYLEEHGTPEEKMAFAQAMEETLQSFTEDDWKEFEAIVETVQDKLPPLEIEPKETTPVVEPVKPEPVKKQEVTVVDNSLEKILHAIHKAINAILLKAKSDKILTERITINWNNKDNFDEMSRLLQTLQKKEHIVRLTTSNTDTNKLLLESIQNFNTRLQIEDEQFVIADTFGLQTDEKTTATNLKKLNKILEFFDSAIASLLPKLIKFFQEYEPEALEKSKEHDDQAKKALEHATKIEKQKKAPVQTQYNDRSSQSQKKQQNYASYPGSQHSGQPQQQEQDPSYIEQIHRNNIKNLPQFKKASPFDKDAADEAGKDKKKENKEISEFQKAINILESYLESNGNAEVGAYTTTINQAGNMYASFGTPLNEADTQRFEKLEAKRNVTASLEPEEVRFMQTYEDKWQKANDNFAKNTQAAHTYYGSLSDSIASISPQLDEILQVIQALKASLNQMSSIELEKIKNAAELKSFEKRIDNYHATFKKVQNELKNKHQLHRLKQKSPNTYSREERDYDELAIKVDNLHGLDKKITETKSQLDYLLKSIKSAIAKRKREENRAASTR